MKLRNWFILTIAFATVAFAQQQRINLLAPMAGFGKGKATFKTRTSTSGFEVEVQAEGERLLRNTKYVLNIGNGKYVRTVTTDVFGHYHWSQRKIGANQAIVRSGDKVILKTTTGAIVQVGIFKVN